VELIELERLSKGEDVFAAVVAVESLADGLDGRVAAPIAMLGQGLGISNPVDDIAHDLHPGQTRDVRDHVVELDVHEHERLLHVLDVRGGVLDDALSMTKQRTQSSDALTRSKTGAQQTVLVELLQPLRVVHVGLATRDILGVARVDQEDLEASRFEDLEDRNPIHAGRLHRDGRDANRLEPVSQRVQVAGEAIERPHRLGIAIRGDRGYMERRADIKTSRMRVDRDQRSRRGFVSGRLRHRLPPTKNPTRCNRITLKDEGGKLRATKETLKPAHPDFDACASLSAAQFK
jgi:hypothetical protein